MNSELKILLILVGVFAVAYLINSYSSEDFSTKLSNDSNNTIASNSNLHSIENFADSDLSEDTEENKNTMESMESMESAKSTDSTESAESAETFSDESIELKTPVNMDSKLKSKNSAPEGSYKSSTYKDGSREQKNNEDIDKFFNKTNEATKQGYLANDEYSGKDETDDKYASYNAGPKKMMTDEEIFKSENYLAKETNQSWFEVPPEPISIKNRHLINISRPIGVNTIGNSLRNPSYDLRGSPPNPKFIVSPWMQSTIEPDLNIKGLC